MTANRLNAIVFLSVPLALTCIYTSYTGLFTVNFYIKEAFNWQVQSVGQDMIDLFLVVPVLLITALLARNGNKISLLLWAGTNLYLVYTFTIFCFDVHFNSLFIFYCINLGLSFYSLMYFIYLQAREPNLVKPENNSWIRVTGLFFIIISALFYFLWLSEIIPAIIHHRIPQNIIDAGLFTNAVHVIDLAVFLPGLMITGITLLKKKSIGFTLAPICLLFFILMDITIGGLIVFMYQKGLETDLIVALVMAGLAVASAALLIWYFLIMNQDEYPE